MRKWPRSHRSTILLPAILRHRFSEVQNVNDPFPRSTILLATAFWAVLVGLMAWTLSATVQTAQTVSAMASTQTYEQRRLDSLDSTVMQHDGRLRVLEVEVAHK
jgi:hypothetical protein